DGEDISLTTRATGKQAKIEIVDDPDGFAARVFGDGEVKSIGQDAEVIVNGIGITSSENTVNLNGLVVQLHQADEDATVRVNVTHDVDAVVDRIKEFVNQYNEIVEELNSALREEVFRDFPPLTDEQKAEMSDKEIELWEERARSGLLRSDRLISGVLSDMRLALGGAVEGLEEYKSLADIGITTGTWFENGKLYLNEEKLRSALSDNADEVRDLFTQAGEGKEQGFAKRLTEVLDRGMERITQTAGRATSVYDDSFLGERIREYEDRLEAMEERLLRTEESHWRRFTAMEQVLSQLYAQSDWLYQQLLGMQGG
ncbi:MAG: flagellar filament capping protein FliD, partial [Limnochordia bacterium]